MLAVLMLLVKKGASTCAWSEIEKKKAIAVVANRMEIFMVVAKLKGINVWSKCNAQMKD
jgi:hypothetical protein